MKRPWVTVNVAMSLDGRIAAAGGRALLLSDLEDQKRVHRLRAGHDAIMVGVGTVVADDPSLCVRGEWVAGARNPMRVVLDPRGRTPPGARVLDGAAPTRIYCARQSQANRFDAPGVAAVVVPGDDEGRLVLEAVLEDLAGAGVRRLMVEGGGRVIASLLAGRLVDEMYLFVAPAVVGRGAPVLVDEPARGVGPLAEFRVVSCESRETGVLLRLAQKPAA